MPKKTHRDNPRNRAPRTIQSGATVLRRVIERTGAHVSHVNQLPGKVQAMLPEALRPHIAGVVEKDGELIILADSAAWAARLRLALGGSGLAGFQRVIVKVAPRGAAG